MKNRPEKSKWYVSCVGKLCTTIKGYPMPRVFIVVGADACDFITKEIV